MPKTKRRLPRAFIAKCVTEARESWRFLFFLLLASLARFAFVSDTLAITSTDLAPTRIATHLALNQYFGVGSAPDTATMPLYPMVLSALIRLTSLEAIPKVIWLLNWLCDIATLVALLRLARRFFPPTASLGLLALAASPLWIGYVTIASPHCLTLALVMIFLERWTLPERGRTDEVLAGLALALATLCEAWLYLFPVFPFLLEAAASAGAKSRKKRRLPVLFLAVALVLPLAWLARNWLYFDQLVVADGMALSFSPARLAELWATSWAHPFGQLYLPEYFGPLYAWIFGGVVISIGAIGLVTDLRAELWHTRPFSRQVLALALYLSLADLLFAVDPHFSILALAPIALWAGPAIAAACDLSVGAAPRKARA